MHRISNQTQACVSFLFWKDRVGKAQLYVQREQDCCICMPWYFPCFFRAYMVFCLRKSGLCGYCECHSAFARLHPSALSYPDAILVSRLIHLVYHQPLSSMPRRTSLPLPWHQVLLVLTTLIPSPSQARESCFSLGWRNLNITIAWNLGLAKEDKNLYLHRSSFVFK